MLDKIKWFWRYYRRFPRVLAVLLLLTPVVVMMQAVVPRVMQFALDFVTTGQVPDNSVARWVDETARSFGIETILALPLLYLLLGIIIHPLYAVVQGHRAWMNRRLDWAIRQNAFVNITDKGPNFFTKFRTGDLVTRLTDDIDGKLSWFACSGIFRFYEAVLLVIFTLLMMITIDPWLTLMTAGPLPVMIFIFFKSSTLLDKRYDTLQTNISSFNAVMESCFAGIRVVKAYVQEKAQAKKFDESIAIRKKSEISAIRAATVIDSLYGYIWQFGIIIVLLAGGLMAIRGTLSVGELFAFVWYGTSLFFPMFDIGQFLVKGLQSSVSIERLRELEQMQPMVVETGNADANGNIVGNLEFRAVSFRFPQGERNIVDKVTFDIPAGKMVALVGKVGSGKTWLTQLVPRLVDPTEGVILLDGRPLTEYGLEDLRRVIGFVPQEPLLFTDTVKNNILFGRESIDDTTLDWAVEVAQLKSEIESFPKGMETMIGTRGMSISGGQKQRLSLARALVGRPKILLLDDCTSALDSRTEAALWERLHEVMPTVTSLVITHRPDTLERADLIVVLEDGHVMESGTHDKLMKLEGTYHRMYKRYQLEETVKEMEVRSPSVEAEG